jgi:hypothetical protein
MSPIQFDQLARIRVWTALTVVVPSVGRSGFCAGSCSSSLGVGPVPESALTRLDGGDVLRVAHTDVRHSD